MTSPYAARQLLALRLMAFAPLAFVPGGFSRFVVAKLLVVAIALAVATRAPANGRLPHLVLILLGAGLAVFAAVSLLGETPVASLLGRWPRYEGVPVLLMYAACAALGARLLGPHQPATAAAPPAAKKPKRQPPPDDRPQRILALVDTTAWMALVLAVFSLLNVLGWDPLGANDLERDGSLLGNATDQGLIAMMAVAVLVGPALERRQPVHLAGLAGALLTVALSGSRAALLLAVLVVLGLALAQRRRLLLPAGGAILALGLAALAVPVTRERILDSATVRGRWIQWDLTAGMVGDHPWLGLGPSRYVDVFGRYESQEWVEWAGTNTVPDSPHNWLLQVLVAGGIPLLVAALALVVVTSRLAWRAVRAEPALLGAAAGAAAYAAAMLANFTVAGSTCFAAFLVGAVIAVPVAGAPGAGAEPRWRQVGATVVAGAAVAALSIACLVEVQLKSAMTHLAEGRRDAAIAAFDTAAALRPGDGDTSMIAAQVLAGAANANPEDTRVAAAAERFARASLERTPETYQSALALAVTQIARQDLGSARSVLDDLIAAYPLRPSARIQRGIALFGLGDVDAALADLRRATSLDPDNRIAKRVLRRMERQLATSG